MAMHIDSNTKKVSKFPFSECFGISARIDYALFLLMISMKVKMIHTLFMMKAFFIFAEGKNLNIFNHIFLLHILLFVYISRDIFCIPCLTLQILSDSCNIV